MDYLTILLSIVLIIYVASVVLVWIYYIIDIVVNKFRWGGTYIILLSLIPIINTAMVIGATRNIFKGDY